MMLSDEEDTDYMSSLGSDDGSQEGGRGGGYILRPDSARRRPGRFREPEEIPFYQNIHPHDPTPYNPVIARFVDQITLPLDHAGPPPSVVKYEAHLRQLDLTHAEFQRQLEIGKGQDPPKANGNFSPFRSVSDGTSNGPTVVHLPPRAGRALTPASKEGEAQDETDQFNDGEVNEYQSNKNQALGNEAAEEPDDEFPADGREYLSNSDDSVSGSQDKIFMPRYQGDSGVAAIDRLWGPLPNCTKWAILHCMAEDLTFEVAVKHLQLDLVQITDFLRQYAHEQREYERFRAEARNLDKPIIEEDGDDDFHLCTDFIGKEDIECGVQLLSSLPMTSARACARKLPSYEGHRHEFLFINGIGDVSDEQLEVIQSAIDQGHRRNYDTLDEEGLAWPQSSFSKNEDGDTDVDEGEECLPWVHDAGLAKQYCESADENENIEISDTKYSDENLLDRSSSDECFSGERLTDEHPPDECLSAANSYDAEEDPMWVEARQTFFDLPELRGPPPDVEHLISPPDFEPAEPDFLPVMQDPDYEAFKLTKDRADKLVRQKYVCEQPFKGLEEFGDSEEFKEFETMFPPISQDPHVSQDPPVAQEGPVAHKGDNPALSRSDEDGHQPQHRLESGSQSKVVLSPRQTQPTRLSCQDGREKNHLIFGDVELPSQLTRPVPVTSDDRQLFVDELDNRWRKFNTWYWAQVDHFRGTHRRLLPLSANPRLGLTQSQNQDLEHAVQYFGTWYLQQTEQLARTQNQFKTLRTELVADVPSNERRYATWINWPPSYEPNDGDYSGVGGHDVQSSRTNPPPQLPTTPLRQPGVNIGASPAGRDPNFDSMRPPQWLISPIRRPNQHQSAFPGGRMVQPNLGFRLPPSPVIPGRPPNQNNDASNGGPGRRTYDPWELAFVRGRAIQIAQLKQAAARRGSPESPQPSRCKPTETPKVSQMDSVNADAWARNHGLWDFASEERKARAARINRSWDQEEAGAPAKHDAEFDPNSMFKERNSLAEALFPSDEEENSAPESSLQGQPSQGATALISAPDLTHRKEKSFGKEQIIGPQAPSDQGRAQNGSQHPREETGTISARPCAPVSALVCHVQRKRAQDETNQEVTTPRRRGRRKNVIPDDEDDFMSGPPSSDYHQLLESDDDYEAVYIPVNDSDDDDFEPDVPKRPGRKRAQRKKRGEKGDSRLVKRVAFADLQESARPAADNAASSSSSSSSSSSWTAAPEPTNVDRPDSVSKAPMSATGAQALLPPHSTGSDPAASIQTTPTRLLNKQGLPYKRGPYKSYKRKSNNRNEGTQGTQTVGTPSAGTGIPVPVPDMSQPTDGGQTAPKLFGKKMNALPTISQPRMPRPISSNHPKDSRNWHQSLNSYPTPSRREGTPIPLPTIPGFSASSLSTGLTKDSNYAEYQNSYQSAATVHHRGFQSSDFSAQQHNLALGVQIMTANQFGTASSRDMIPKGDGGYHRAQVSPSLGESQLSATYSASKRIHVGAATGQPGSVLLTNGYPINQQVSQFRPEGLCLSSTGTGTPHVPKPIGLSAVQHSVSQRFPDILPGNRPTEILVGYWRSSGKEEDADKHAVFGVIGTKSGSSFRLKVGKQTRDGRPLGKETMPDGAGRIWLKRSDCELEGHLRDLNHDEVREYCRVRQWQKDRGEEDGEVLRNVLVAVDEARCRVAHIPMHIRNALNAEDPAIAAGPKRARRRPRPAAGSSSKNTAAQNHAATEGKAFGAPVNPEDNEGAPASLAFDLKASATMDSDAIALQALTDAVATQVPNVKAAETMVGPMMPEQHPVPGQKEVPSQDVDAQALAFPAPREPTQQPRKPTMEASCPPAAHDSIANETAEFKDAVQPREEANAAVSPDPSPKKRGRPRKKPSVATAAQNSVTPAPTDSDGQVNARALMSLTTVPRTPAKEESKTHAAPMGPAAPPKGPMEPRTPVAPPVLKRGRGRPRKHPIVPVPPPVVPSLATGVVQSSANAAQAWALIAPKGPLVATQTASRVNSTPVPKADGAIPTPGTKAHGDFVAAAQHPINVPAHGLSCFSPVSGGEPIVGSSGSNAQNIKGNDEEEDEEEEEEEEEEDDEPVAWKPKRFKRLKLTD